MISYIPAPGGGSATSVQLSEYDANTILKADTDNTPVALTIPASTFVGRKSTGTIAAMSISEAKTELGAGSANGLATLDSGGKVPLTQLPSSIMEYKGVWDASTNTPTLIDGTGDTGEVYRVSVSGSQNLGSGAISFVVGDYVIYNSSGVWEKSDTTDAVASVYGRTGNVVATNGDYTASNITNVPYATTAATTVQAAINELTDEKASLNSAAAFSNLEIDSVVINDSTISAQAFGAYTGALNLTPLSGQNLNITLGTTGDLAVNTNQLYVDTSTARVGIGTTTPTTSLQVAGTVTATLFSGSGASLTTLSASNLSSGTVPSGVMTGAYTGVTGLGTLTLLQVDNLNLDLNTVSSTSGALNLTPLSGQNLNITLETTGDLAVNTNQLYVDTSTGFVGIGTASPGHKLVVQSTSAVASVLISSTTFTSGDQCKLYFGNTDHQINAKYGTNEGLRIQSADGIRFYLGGAEGSQTEKMRITSTGNVGIGTSSPNTSSILDLTSTTGALLLPRMTSTQRDALTPAAGMVIYNTTTSTLEFRSASAWVAI